MEPKPSGNGGRNAKGGRRARGAAPIEVAQPPPPIGGTGGSMGGVFSESKTLPHSSFTSNLASPKSHSGPGVSDLRGASDGNMDNSSRGMGESGSAVRSTTAVTAKPEAKQAQAG